MGHEQIWSLFISKAWSYLFTIPSVEKTLNDWILVEGGIPRSQTVEKVAESPIGSCQAVADQLPTGP